MVNTLILDNPILINGKEVKELTYDANEITAIHFAEADAHRMLATASRITKGKVGVNASAELDYTFHMYLGIMAVIAVNPDIDVSDLERAKGDDVRQLMGIGRFFISGRLGALSQENNSDDSSETIPEPSMSQPENSNGNE